MTVRLVPLKDTGPQICAFFFFFYVAQLWRKIDQLYSLVLIIHNYLTP